MMSVHDWKWSLIEGFLLSVVSVFTLPSQSFLTAKNLTRKVQRNKCKNTTVVVFMEKPFLSFLSVIDKPTKFCGK